ncbi:MAG: cytochrome c [Flavobacteriaceae bacterium]|nr:cytochrome c [Flavobacteriaceae bacterium]
MVKNKNIAWLVAGSFAAAIIISSCGKSRGNDPGTEYMPDMYDSRAYEPMTQLEDQPHTLNPMGLTMRVPAGNTIARGQLSYYYPFTKEQYEEAKVAVKMPASVAKTEANLIKGKHYYDINCTPCHGETGMGDGPVSAKFPPKNIPSYADARIQTLEDGGIYHSITYGKNLMGAYGTVLTPEERWCVVQYVHYLRNKAKGSGETAAAAPADTTKKN